MRKEFLYQANTGGEIGSSSESQDQEPPKPNYSKMDVELAIKLSDIEEGNHAEGDEVGVIIDVEEPENLTEEERDEMKSLGIYIPSDLKSGIFRAGISKEAFKQRITEISNLDKVSFISVNKKLYSLGNENTTPNII